MLYYSPCLFTLTLLVSEPPIQCLVIREQQTGVALITQPSLGVLFLEPLGCWKAFFNMTLVLE